MNYILIIIPIASVLITQAIKLSIDRIKGNFNWHCMLYNYGGMPSSHSAFVASLVTEIAFVSGIASPLFAVSLVFGIIVLRDAKGLRNYIGKTNREVNGINKELGKTKIKLDERVGHTSLEIFIGCLIGVVIAIIGMAL